MSDSLFLVWDREARLDNLNPFPGLLLPLFLGILTPADQKARSRVASLRGEEYITTFILPERIAEVDN
jgi:hypothetical protein